ncbi:MAG: baseplate J/gp47 family protein [Bacillota bacterium]|nr:baseplate J/gp47 family protein [Bacillota bacterium]
MLSHHMLQELTFENLIQEARNQIPLYTQEWTNFNPSDPAETILENLSAFTIMQQAYIDRMPEAAQEKLFAMAGFFKGKGRNARILLEARNVEEPVRIPAGQRFQVGEILFETNRENILNGYKLTGIYGRQNEEVVDYSFILDEDYPVDAAIFTEKPQVGMEIYLVMDGMVNAGEEVIFHVDLAKDYKRNAFTGENLFAEIQWQLYTEKGFVNLRMKDGTGCLLNSGEMRFRVPKEKLAIYEEFPQKGYVVRGILKRADYDIFPKIAKISGFLFEVWQKEKKSICYTYGRVQSFELFSDILEEGYLRVFCKETQNGPYYLYEQEKPWSDKGRYYRLERIDYGIYRFSFDKEAFGFAPGNLDNAVKLVAYNEDMMRQQDLGMLYGYDNQEIILPNRHVVKEGFTIIAEKQNEAGEKVYSFVKPSSDREDEFHYTLLENDGIVRVDEAAGFIGCRIFLGGFAVSKGPEGNVRAGSQFFPIGYRSDVVFRNPAAGTGGCFAETVYDVRRRLIEDLRKHYTAVEAKDYEDLVRTTPELCIRKVKAVRDGHQNSIQVTAMPMCNEEFPLLSEIYQKAIRERLEKARLLTVNIDLQQPVYVPVHVRGTIYVKPHYEGCKEQIEELIIQELDYINSERNFGDRFHFDELFHLIESLPCVKYIYELTVTPNNSLHAAIKGLDIQPKDNCLLYPGEIALELNTTE